LELPTYKCLRCQHEWIPRTRRKPRVCPKCKSPYWDIRRQIEIEIEEEETKKATPRVYA
jgi:Zn finger protein HypA/HybF involved in hydrogenase expression